MWPFPSFEPRNRARIDPGAIADTLRFILPRTGSAGTAVSLPQSQIVLQLGAWLHARERRGSRATLTINPPGLRYRSQCFPDPTARTTGSPFSNSKTAYSWLPKLVAKQWPIPASPDGDRERAGRPQART